MPSGPSSAHSSTHSTASHHSTRHLSGSTTLAMGTNTNHRSAPALATGDHAPGSQRTGSPRTSTSLCSSGRPAPGSHNSADSIPTFITIDLENGLEPIIDRATDGAHVTAGAADPISVPTPLHPMTEPNDNATGVNLAALAFNVFGHDNATEEISDQCRQSRHSHQHWTTQEWEQHAHDAREQTDCRPPSESQTAEIAHLCAKLSKAQRCPTGNLNSILPGGLSKHAGKHHANTTALDEEALAYFVLTSQPIRDSILTAGKLQLTPALINHVLQRLADSWRRSGEHTARARIQTAAKLIEQYGHQALKARRKDPNLPASEKTFTKAIEQFTAVIMEDLQRRRTTSAGILAGTLVAAVYAHAERKDKAVRQAVATTSLLVTGLWAWSFVGPRVALSAAIAVSAFSLFEYSNLAPQRRLEAHELETSFLYAAMDSQSPFDRPFFDGLHFALRVNHIDV